MPERTEIYVQHQQICYFLERTKRCDRRLRDIWADHVDHEVSHSTDPRGRQALVFVLGPHNNLTRGQHGQRKTLASHSHRQHPHLIDDDLTDVDDEMSDMAAQRSDSAMQDPWFLFPKQYLSSMQNHSYALEESLFNPECATLKFVDDIGAELFVEIKLQLHTSVQFYTVEDWFSRICKVPMLENGRGFRVAIAFQLETHVVAFLTKDMLFHVYWATEHSALPRVHVHDVLNDWRGFLSIVCHWLSSLSPSQAEKSAFLFVKDSNCFPGLGVYTLSEVSHIAGLPLNLTVAQLFLCPSRFARFMMAYRALALYMQHRMWPSTARFFRGTFRDEKGFTLAVQRRDRLYFKSSLRVYGKHICHTTNRMASLIEDGVQRCEAHLPILFDAFDPLYMECALRLPDNLGHLIFGKGEWSTLAVISQGTHLKPNFYRDLVLVEDEMFPLTRQRKLVTTMYKFVTSPNAGFIEGQEPDAAYHQLPSLKKRKRGEKKQKFHTYQAWTVFPMPSSTVKVGQHLRPMTAHYRSISTLMYKICHGKFYTVGPMDFCGMARIEPRQGGGEVILLCENDPGISAYYRKRHASSEKNLKTRFINNCQRRVSRTTAYMKLKYLATRAKPSHKRDPHSILPPRRPPLTDDMRAVVEAVTHTQGLPATRIHT